MKQQSRVFILIVLSTLCSLIICRLSLPVALIIDLFVFCSYVVLKSVFEALMNNESEMMDEIKEYRNMIENLRNDIQMGSLDSLRTNINTSSTIQ